MNFPVCNGAVSARSLRYQRREGMVRDVVESDVINVPASLCGRCIRDHAEPDLHILSLIRSSKIDRYCFEVGICGALSGVCLLSFNCAARTELDRSCVAGQCE